MPTFLNRDVLAGWLVGYFVFANLTQTGFIWEEGTSTKIMPPSDWPAGQPMGNFLDQ